MKLKTLYIALLPALVSCSSGGGATESPDTGSAARKEMSNGKKLFINNCVQCHDVNSNKNGPMLAGAIERWNNDTARITAYIKNSQAVIKTDPYAAKLYEAWHGVVMPPFPNLSEKDIKEILVYIAEEKD
jgi:mono/diheme cytochrome c family protein